MRTHERQGVVNPRTTSGSTGWTSNYTFLNWQALMPRHEVGRGLHPRSKEVRPIGWTRGQHQPLAIAADEQLTDGIGKPESGRQHYRLGAIAPADAGCLQRVGRVLFRHVILQQKDCFCEQPSPSADPHRPLLAPPLPAPDIAAHRRVRVLGHSRCGPASLIINLRRQGAKVATI